MNTKNKALKQKLPTKFIPNKIQDGGGRHIEITGWAVAQTCCISQCA